ncbi:MAG: hypothetical protein IJD92_03670 [Bacilli bacterium]|nr:hypothetical protein [Bacilli bacterium]
MNNNGKGTIIFIILIPIFFIISIIICDTVVSYSANKKFKITTEKIIKETVSSDLYYEDYDEYIKTLYERYNYETDMLYINATEDYIYLENEHKYFGLLSSLNNKGESTTIKILGIPFKVKKSSRIFLKLEANIISEDEIEFIYTK